MIEVPEYVVDALEYVRSTGLTNMFDSNNVITIAFDAGYYNGADWIDNNKKFYVEALHALGDRLAKKDG